ncbi:hypothetical protein, partial [Novosphingobium hassiacum]|uniref:hypothetical protein n=1 Tax=Novosphingobium hassiacum TaxID=173676 RepID=UPI001C84EF8E
GIGFGLRPTPIPTHRILILIVALSHPDRRATFWASSDKRRPATLVKSRPVWRSIKSVVRY